MHRFKGDILARKIMDSERSMNQLSRDSIELLGGSGITAKTVGRAAYQQDDMRISTLLALCAVLDIAPGPLFERIEKWER